MSNWVQLLLGGGILTSVGAGLKYLIDSWTGKRARRITDSEAELRLAETVKRIANEQVSDLEERVHKAEERITKMEDALVAHVWPLINWLDDGAPPPAPEVPDHLRALLRDVRAGR